MRNRFPFLFLFIILLLGVSGNPTSSQTLPYTQYTTKDGLMSNWTTAFAQDSRGYIWVGTSEGLSRFDGISFVNYTTKDGLANNYIECIVEWKSRPNTLLVGTHDGLTVFDHGIARIFRDGAKDITFGVADILCGRDGTIWVGTSHGLYTLNDSTLHKVQSVGDIGIRDLDEAMDGSLYLAGENELFILRPNRRDVVKRSLGMPSRYVVTAIRADTDGTQWVATDDSLLFHMRDTILLGKFTMPIKWIASLLDGNDGTLWGCTMLGILRIPKQTPEQATYITTGGAYRAFIDRENNLWQTGEGIRMHPLTSTVFFPDPAETGGITQTVQLVDTHHHFWSWSVNNGGIFEYWLGEQNTWKRTLHKIPNIPASWWVTIDPQNRLWCASGDRPNVFLSCFRIENYGSRSSSLKFEKRIPLRRWAPYFSFRGNNEIWLLYEDSVIECRDRYHDSILSTYNAPFKEFGARCSLIDHNNILWVGEFYNGLFSMNIDSPGVWHKMTTADGLPDNHIRSVLEDHEGSLWIGTRYGGAAVYRNNKVESFDVKDGLPSNWVHYIYQDSSGRLWFCTSLGLAYLENTSATTIRIIPAFHHQDIGSIGEIQKGVYWIHSNAGNFFYNFNKENEHNANPIVSISRVEMNGKELLEYKNAQFSYDQNHFSVRYAGIFFKNPHQLRYLYRLDGVEATWHEPTIEKSVTYNNLNPGHYVFTVKAITGNGIESTSAATVQFVITPAFWERWWFRALAIVLVLSIGMLVYVRRVNTLKQKNALHEQFSRQLIESQENERKRIAASLHDSLGQNLILSKNHAMMGLKVSKEPESIEQLNEISSLLSQSLDEVREIAYNLRPYHLDRIGLTRTLEFIIDKVKSSTSIQCATEIENIDHLLSPEAEISLYRIVQESLNNIVKHSDATTMRCTITKNTNHLDIEIVDNGKGFDKQATAKRVDGTKGFGLNGMAERIRLLNGAMRVDSKPNQGAALTFTIPYKIT